MTLEDKAEIVISQLREDRDRLQNIIEQIRAEIVEMRSKQNCSCSDCLDIIDKYIESENKKCI